MAGDQDASLVENFQVVLGSQQKRLGREGVDKVDRAEDSQKGTLEEGILVQIHQDDNG